jgi:uncharacterized OB-fold protein
MRPDFPLPDTSWAPTAEFWAGAARGELRLPRCDGCARLRWYPEATCRRCHAEGSTWQTLSGRATLFSWVVVTHPFLAPFRDKTPFVPALVALEEDPAVRLATQIVDTDPDALAFEMSVQVTFRPMSFTGIDGTVVAPYFRPG